MSSVNYSLKHKGVRLISAEEAWKETLSGEERENEIKPKISFCGQGFFNNA